ncbi:MAG: FkbM family methyltransferase [Burkholderiales bacterium]|nr:FkbM family methyltransferase [Burkholderiales bacterium]
MLTRFLRSAAASGPPAAAPQASAVPVETATDPSAALWYMPPPALDGYAGLVRSSQGVFIVPDQDEGVGRQLRTFGAYEGPQLDLLCRMAGLSRGEAILDIGANIGVTTVVMARAALSGVTVHAYEAQRVVYWMLAGNLAVNGVDNARCRLLAIGAAVGEARVPVLDYRRPARFGSVELDRVAQSDALQDARDGRFETVAMASVDSLHAAGVGLMKIDVEGMEVAVLRGAAGAIARDRPLLFVEHLKSDTQGIVRLLDDAGYRLFDFADNHVGLPRERTDLDALAADLAAYAVPRP